MAARTIAVAGVLIAALMLSSGHSAGSQERRGDEESWQPLMRAVQEYIALQHAVKRTVGGPIISRDRRTTLAALDAMAAAIKTARASAREGDILGGATGTLLRTRIADAVHERHLDPVAIRAAALGDDDEEEGPRPVINERYSWSWPSFAPPSVLGALPELPGELQYRFIGSDLVLVDIDANIIVDVLRDAFPLTRD